MLFQHYISYDRIQSYVLCAVCDRFERGDFQMHSGCRVLEEFVNDFGCIERLSGNKTFMREDLMSHAGQG